jgi:hypothetical protein
MRRLAAVAVVAAGAVAGVAVGWQTAPTTKSSATLTASHAVVRHDIVVKRVVSERNKPGTPWRIKPATPADIAGYADRTSVRPGEPVGLYVSTNAQTFAIRVFRMGWYRGVLARQTGLLGPFAGVAQSPANIVEPRHTAIAQWTVSTLMSTRRWLPGDYLLRLEGADGGMSFIPLTVRAASAAGRVVLINAVTTWQAYNRWGCCSLYAGTTGTFADRSRAVSFDRPYAAEYGAGEFIDRELPILGEAERLGLRLDYATDVDVDLDPSLLAGARAVISMGHDEYWSPAMRQAVMDARDIGTNVAFFSANDIFRRIRFEPSQLGPDRVEVDYKVASEDPLDGIDNSAVTADWPYGPDPEPESALVGPSYDCFVRQTAAGVVVDPTSFLLRGTGATDGEQLPGLIGPEVDRVVPGGMTPRPLEILLHSPFQCPPARSSAADATYYTAASGAGVFDAGTMDWPCAMAGSCGATVVTRAFVDKVTDNVLVAFAHGPAGHAHPAADNVDTVLRLAG